jgi:hypothetical protein
MDMVGRHYVAWLSACADHPVGSGKRRLEFMIVDRSHTVLFGEQLGPTRTRVDLDIVHSALHEGGRYHSRVGTRANNQRCALVDLVLTDSYEVEGRVDDGPA